MLCTYIQGPRVDRFPHFPRSGTLPQESQEDNKTQSNATSSFWPVSTAGRRHQREESDNGIDVDQPLRSARLPQHLAVRQTFSTKNTTITGARQRDETVAERHEGRCISAEASQRGPNLACGWSCDSEATVAFPCLSESFSVRGPAWTTARVSRISPSPAVEGPGRQQLPWRRPRPINDLGPA